MPAPPNRPRRGPGPGASFGIVLFGAVLLAGLVIALGGFFESDQAGTSDASISPQKALEVEEEKERSGPRPTPIAVVKRKTALRARPDGRRVATIGRRTEFGSARVLAVVDQREEWLEVLASELPNGKTGWVDVGDTKPGGVDFKLRVDLSARRIDIIKAGRVVRRIRSAVGEQGTPTPTGQFAITDKVPFTDRGSPYGCCALALTAHQPNTPSEWSGGDRIAIHATPARASIGQSVTLGCMRVPDRDARWLMRRIPLGTQVSIRA